VKQQKKQKPDKSISYPSGTRKKILQFYRVCTFLSLSLALLNSCTSVVENSSDPRTTNTNISSGTLSNISIYSVMYKVWEQNECVTKINGSVIDTLFKEGQFNGFVCVSQNPDYIGQQDTIGINFYAESLEHCQKIASSYWTGAPSNHYSWYPSPSSLEQNRFRMGSNTCSVEYPNR